MEEGPAVCQDDERIQGRFRGPRCRKRAQPSRFIVIVGALFAPDVPDNDELEGPSAQWVEGVGDSKSSS